MITDNSGQPQSQVLKISALFLGISLMICSCNSLADYRGKVVRIVDGDTVIVLVQKEMKRVRLDGIDAPESKQAFGNVSKQSLVALVAQKDVFVSSNKVDRYGRDLGTLFLNGQDINALQISTGMAWAYRYMGVPSNPSYVELESNAKASRLGLWAENNTVAPWEWRKAKKGD